LLVYQGILVTLDLRVWQVFQAFQAFRESRAILGHRELRDQWGHRAQLV